MTKKYQEAYWQDVADILRDHHHVGGDEIPLAVATYREHMKPAGITIYNESPEDVAASVVRHAFLTHIGTGDAP